MLHYLRKGHVPSPLLLRGMAIAIAVACPVALTAGSIEHVSSVAVLRQSPNGTVVTAPLLGTGPPLLHEEPALRA